MCQWCRMTRGGKRERRAKVIAALMAKWRGEGVVWTYFVTYSPPDDLGLRSAMAMHGWWRSILNDVLWPCRSRLHADRSWWAVEAFKRADAHGRTRVHLHGFLRCPRAGAGTWRRIKELFWRTGAGRLRLSSFGPAALGEKTGYALKYMLKEHRLGRYTTGSWKGGAG